MRYMTQPNPSNLCGQTCVAMILEITLAEAISRVGSRGGTRTKQLIRVLRDSCKVRAIGSRMTRIGKDFTPPKWALMRVVWNEGDHVRRHWVVWHHGWWFDPADTTIRKGSDGLMAPPGARVTSYLELRPLKPLG
jgi:hypothetical protein